MALEDFTEAELAIARRCSATLALAKKQGSKHHIRYEEILRDLSEQRLEKVRQYGESRYEEEDEEFNLWMCFSDIHRKFIRLKQLMESWRSKY